MPSVGPMEWSRGRPFPSLAKTAGRKTSGPKKDQQGSTAMAKKKTTRKKTAKKTAKKTVRKAAAKKTTRKKTAKKTVRKKTAKKAPAKKAPTIKGSVAPRTKSQIFNTIAEATEMSRKEVTAVVSTLESMMVADLKKGTPVKFMGMKMTVKKKPATKA
ncbi:MAG: hypothetical protein CMJ54_07530, partial [Planctomycetaceae bacterium]|nr:hypothetical protein [Planctomycetaceae bacterium]